MCGSSWLVIVSVEFFGILVLYFKIDFMLRLNIVINIGYILFWMLLNWVVEFGKYKFYEWVNFMWCKFFFIVIFNVGFWVFLVDEDRILLGDFSDC